MKKKTWAMGALIIVSAIIWGAVILGCSFSLRGTECYTEIQNILAGGAGLHLILIWGPMAILFIIKNKNSTDRKIE